jgi:hypothetical protein
MPTYYDELNETQLYKCYEQTREAIRQGILIPKPCEWPCCTVATQATLPHHNDYANPLDITWLCNAHHYKRHMQIFRERKANGDFKPNQSTIKLWPDGYDRFPAAFGVSQKTPKFMAHFPDICYCKDCKLKRKEKLWQKIVATLQQVKSSPN